MDWLTNNSLTIVLSLCSGIVGSLLTNAIASLRDRMISRNVAYAVVFSLQKEVEKGLETIEKTKANQYAKVGSLPTDAWLSVQTLLSDRNVLDSILRYGKKGKVSDERIGSTFGDVSFAPYKVEELLSHLNNYFCYMVHKLSLLTPGDFANPSRVAQLYVGTVNINLTLKGILNGLSR